METAVCNFGFQNSDKLLFHIDEAMSWECVRNLKLMKETLLLVHNIARQSAPGRNKRVGGYCKRKSRRSSFGNCGGRKTLSKKYFWLASHNPALKRDSAKARRAVAPR